METMAVRATTAPPLVGTGRQTSSVVRPSPSLSFAGAGFTRPCARLGVGLSARSGRATGAPHAVPRGIVASAEVEQSYIMVKPDGVQRGLVGEIISRFEKKGFLLKGLKLFQCSKDLAQATKFQALLTLVVFQVLSVKQNRNKLFAFCCGGS